MKLNRVVYRFWHNKSARGRVGYIGKDSYYPRRFNLSVRKNRTNHPKLYQALNKYPLSVWHKEVLVSGIKSDAALNKAEIYWIKKFDSKNKGYNCTDGGEGQRGWKPSPLTITRMRKSQAGKKMSPEARDKIAEALIGNENGKNNKGKRRSLESRLKMSKAKIGNTNARGNKGKKHSVKSRKKVSRSIKIWWAKRKAEQAELNGESERTNSSRGSRAA
jgi:group I intron endonuclease